MFLSATEVAVKEYDASLSTRSMVLYEGKIMSSICCGHPNLPIFMGMYDFTGGLPYLVTKYYSVKGEPLTLHKLLTRAPISKEITIRQWILIGIGICSAVESVHTKCILHNDIKCDNIILSDLVPAYANSPPLWPILIDFGKARPFIAPKRYYLSESDKVKYRKEYPHLAPELIQGTYAQNQKTDVYSFGRVLLKISEQHQISQLETVSNKCMSKKPDHRPSACSLHSLLCDLT